MLCLTVQQEVHAAASQGQKNDESRSTGAGGQNRIIGVVPVIRLASSPSRSLSISYVKGPQSG